MKKIIQKAGVLIEALPYFQQFRNETVVIKFGGSAMEEKKNADSILTDIIFMECVGMKPVIVHGGGKAISRRMNAEGIHPAFVKGRRVTDKASMRIVETVLNNELNPGLVKTLCANGARARGLRGQDFIKAAKHFEKDEHGQPIDLGFVGVPAEVDPEPVLDCLRRGVIAVITPIGIGPDGNAYNINADDAAAAVASAIKAKKLVFLSDIPGLLKNPSDPDSIFSTLNVSEVKRLVKSGVIDGGMLPKVNGGVRALASGVSKVHIIDGRVPHSLLLEIFTDKGIGTEIVHHDRK